MGHPLLFLATSMPESQPLRENYNTSFTVLEITIWGSRRQGFIDKVGGCLESRGVFIVAMHVTEVKNKSKMSREDGQELLLRSAGCELLTS